MDSKQAPSASVATARVGIRAILEGWAEPAALIGRDYTILEANCAYRDLFAKVRIEGKTCYQVSHHSRLPCDQKGERCPIGEALATGRPSRAMHLHFTELGREYHEVSIHPLRDQGGEITSYIEIITPITSASARPTSRSPVGASRAFREALELLERAAPTETTVLLLGETGTGKELLARAIHGLSARSTRNFVPVDCSGLTESLFESELFGHEKGSFTGASHRKRGLVEVAEGGTLFLDEVGDIPLSLQVKLLRLLESGTYRRVGSPDELRADYRLVCATHQDLEAMVRAGRFRADLYYRISVFPVRVPPLRERVEDLPLLVESLLQRLRPDKPLRLSEEALALLEGYSFPGNVRELLNMLERAALLTDGELIEPRHLPGARRSGGEPTASREAVTEGRLLTLADQERRYLRWVVQHRAGDNASLAEALGVSERTLYRKLQELRAEPAGPGSEPSRSA
ncbi:MAG TPA: sigma 54-interacting transcriptional regulator [Thermoanaerobaculia bacterium]|nr:sigma 54-interacting transcriptional regulator [Thermoanaerobaculia bacterium]